MKKNINTNKNNNKKTAKNYLHGILSLSITAFTCLICGCNSPMTEEESNIRFGMVTDAHFAECNMNINRYYKESTAKMTDCVNTMNNQKIDFLIELGDFKDQGNPINEKNTLKYLKHIETVFAKFNGPRYHVIGNHDVDSISKEQFLAVVENTGIDKKSTYYSFDMKGIHFVVLDADYNADGTDYNHGNFRWTDTNVPSEELSWLEKDLTVTTKPVVIFIHQQLDGIGHHYVKNAAQVRAILEKSKKVIAVFQGHHHPGNYQNINGIHYYTLKAMVEGHGDKNNSYAIVEIDKINNSINITGFHNAISKKLAIVLNN